MPSGDRSFPQILEEKDNSLSLTMNQFRFLILIMPGNFCPISKLNDQLLGFQLGFKILKDFRDKKNSIQFCGPKLIVQLSQSYVYE